MHGSSSLTSAGTAAGSQVLSRRAPPANGSQASSGRDAAGPAAVTRDPSEGNDELAQLMNDIVVRRIFAAGLDLQGALLLIGEHQGAGKILHAIDEMDHVVREIRDILFDRQLRRQLGG
jgi:hypothetical protein